MTPARNAWAWTRLPMSRPCMSGIATIKVSIRPSRTSAWSAWRRGWLAPPPSPWAPWVAVVMGTLPAAGRPIRALRLGLLRGHPAVGHDDAAGDERRFVRGEEQRDFGALAWLARPADRLDRVDCRLPLAQAAAHLRMGVVDRRIDPARCDRVAPDALLRVVERDPLAEHDDRALRGRINR